MRAQHINITLPVDLKMRLDEESKREHLGRSTIIQKAVALYLTIIKKKRMKRLLIEGYSEMSVESLRVTHDFKKLDDEALGYVD